VFKKLPRRRRRIICVSAHAQWLVDQALVAEAFFDGSTRSGLDLHRRAPDQLERDVTSAAARYREGMAALLVRHDPQDHMHRIPRVEIRSRLVRRPGSRAVRWSSGAAPLAARCLNSASCSGTASALRLGDRLRLTTFH